MASTTTRTRISTGSAISPPTWIKPHLAALLKAAPDGSDWLHEIKMDGYRMHARLDAGRVNILTRRGNDWAGKYPLIAQDVAVLPAKSAYLDGELCGILPDAARPLTSFRTPRRGPGSPGVLPIRLPFLDGEALMEMPLVDRTARLEMVKRQSRRCDSGF
jgi:ATP-dependent DNA ligase